VESPIIPTFHEPFPTALVARSRVRVRRLPALRLASAIAASVVAAAPARAQQADQEAAAAAQANNPLANIKTLSFQNYQYARLYGSDETANTLWLRSAIPTGRVLWRASLPLQTSPTQSGYESGLGDFNVFGAYLVKESPELNVGVGPTLTIPTATGDALGTGKWQGGVTGVVFAVPSPVFQVGGLVTWQLSFAGDDARDATNLLAVQPFLFWQVGRGWYLRSSAISVFNFEAGTYNLPLGTGAGKVIRMGKVVFNVYGEGQFTVLHDGVGQPATQIFIGFNAQFVGG
jgi:hypothetical protein